MPISGGRVRGAPTRITRSGGRRRGLLKRRRMVVMHHRDKLDKTSSRTTNNNMMMNTSSTATSNNKAINSNNLYNNINNDAKRWNGTSLPWSIRLDHHPRRLNAPREKRTILGRRKSPSSIRERTFLARLMSITMKILLRPRDWADPSPSGTETNRGAPTNPQASVAAKWVTSSKARRL